MALIFLSLQLWGQDKTPSSSEESGASSDKVPAVVGLWEGTLSVSGMKFRLGLNVKFEKGVLRSTLDSVDQGAMGIPVKRTSFKNGQFEISLPIIVAKFTGTLNADETKISGTWQQGLRLPLTLKRVKKASQLNRPQTPTGPFPYRSVEITIDRPVGNTKKTASIAGSLVLPEGKGPFPAVLLVTGNEATDRDYKMAGHRPYLVLADDLARRGIASLRYDGRDVGKTTVPEKGATGRDRAEDAKIAWEYLKNRPEIQSNKVGIMGHSSGATIATMVANQVPLAFVVHLAGPGVNGRQILDRRLVVIMKLEGIPDQALQFEVDIQTEMLDTLIGNKVTPKSVVTMMTLLAKLLKNSRYFERLSATERSEVARRRVRQLLEPWFRFYLTYDPREALRTIPCPILVMCGSLDSEVVPAQNLPEIAKALASAPTTDWSMVKLPGLNHLFQTAKKGTPSEYGSIQETFAPQALEIIADWIARRVAPNR